MSAFTTREIILNAVTTADATADGHTVEASKGYTIASSGYEVGCRSKVSIQVASTETTPVCYVDISQDNSTWTPYNRITSNATGAYAGVGSVTGNITNGVMLLIPAEDHFEYIRVQAVFGTPMTVSATITATLHAF